ncbi:MAG: hypothetical protein IKR46_01480 [Clostridia bacterium]|jgi:hypothetical protein|nr:hypothetical protein [Clostridia bacterium]
MALDINKIKDAIVQLTKDEEARKAFQENPVKEVERVTGLDLNDDEINSVINAAKAKIEGGDLDDILVKIGQSPIFDKITDLFNKK